MLKLGSFLFQTISHNFSYISLFTIPANIYFFHFVTWNYTATQRHNLGTNLTSLEPNTYPSVKISAKWQKQPYTGVLKERCSEDIHQICRRIPIPKCDFIKVAFELYLNRTSVWVFPCKFAVYFQTTFS